MTTQLDKNGYIASDLDGTLAIHYWPEQGYYNPLKIGDPIPLMVNRVKQWLAEGIDVRIFTARITGHTPEFTQLIVKAIEDWCLVHLGKILPITATKDQYMVLLYDDRARQVEHNIGRVIGEDE
jgi:hypothetical protein